jgi:transmembrane sensor
VSTGPDRTALQTAAEWAAELRDAAPDSPAHTAHERWLAQDPMHRRAWARVARLQHTMAALPSDIVQPTLERARTARSGPVKAIALIAVLGGLVFGGLQNELHHRVLADHATGAGERQAMTLSDGSSVALNARSAITIRFDERRRLVHLLYGEIAVTTSDDPQRRPLVVSTRRGEIEALGTRFLVRIEADKDRVTVLEDAVEIRPSSDPLSARRLVAGQQAGFGQQSVGRVAAREERPAAWTEGLLIVSDWTLGRFLDELARHYRGHLAYDDSIADLRISGAFHLDDIDALLDNVASTLPVTIQRVTPFWARIAPTSN